LELEMEVNHNKEAAAKQQDLLRKLQATSDEAERKRILDLHTAQMGDLERQHNADKERQMQLLEKKIAARKERRLKVEHAEMAAKEMALLADPSKLAEANKVMVQMKLQVQQEADAARLQLDHEQEATAAAAAMRLQQEFLLESEKKLEEGRLQEKLARAGNDDAARQKLLREHELKLAELEARKAMEKGKADDELQKKLEERRNKKKKVQEQLHQQQIETVAKTSADGVAKELDELQREGMLMVRQEEDAAQAAFDLVEEAQAASAILTQELAERVELECGSEEARFQELLRNGNLSAQEREAMIANHELKLKAINTQVTLPPNPHELLRALRSLEQLATPSRPSCFMLLRAMRILEQLGREGR